MNSHTTTPTFILIAGHWLGEWAWADVTAQLRDNGYSVNALTLPGLDPNDPQRLTRSVHDQVLAIEAAIAATPGPVILVGHSGANAPLTVVLDRNPARISRVVWIDSGPVRPGSAFAPDLPAELTEVPLPPLDQLGQQASLDGMTEEQLARFTSLAVSQPAAQLRERATLEHTERFNVPTTFVCHSFPSAQVIALVEAQHPMFAEVANYTQVNYVDLPTGHWPMFSEAPALADALGSLAEHEHAE